MWLNSSHLQSSLYPWVEGAVGGHSILVIPMCRASLLEGKNVKNSGTFNVSSDGALTLLRCFLFPLLCDRNILLCGCGEEIQPQDHMEDPAR